MTPLVRPRRQVDLPAAAAVLADVHVRDGYPVDEVAEPESWLTPPGLLRAWVAELDGRVVGHVGVCRPRGEEAVSLWTARSRTTDDEVAVLARLYVHPEARGNAFGRLLLEVATGYAREQRRRLVLDVMAKDTAAIGLYERLGWQRLGSVVHTFDSGDEHQGVCYVAPAG